MMVQPTKQMPQLEPEWQQLIDNGCCPIVACGGELDTGFECNRCGADCIALIDDPDFEPAFRGEPVSLTPLVH